MNQLSRLVNNLCSSQIPESKAFYVNLFDFEVLFDSDWFVNLKAKNQPFELGIIATGHEIVPEGVKPESGGFYQTFVVEDVEEIFSRAQDLDYHVIKEPQDTFYGQRRLLLRDPDGNIVDVSAPIPDFTFE